MAQATYKVTGMSCDHCKKAVTDEVSGLPGVTGVSVDVAAGLVTVTASDLDDSAVAAAVDEAGYALEGRA